MIFEERLQEINKKMNGWFSEWIEKLPEQRKLQVLDILDHAVYYLSNFYHQHERVQEIEEKVLLEARLFNSKIERLEEISKLSMSQLEYIEEKFKSKYSMYSLIEGGVAGLGNPLFLVLDLPALLTINMKMIQAISSTYGFSMRSPVEQIIALKVLYGASLPKADQQESLDDLYEQYVDRFEELAFLQEDATFIQSEWLETLGKQLIKSLALYGLSKTSKNNISLIGIAVGAKMNYQFTKTVAQFASTFYRERYEYVVSGGELHEHTRT